MADKFSSSTVPVTPDLPALGAQQADGQTDLVTPAARVAAEALAAGSILGPVTLTATSNASSGSTAVVAKAISLTVNQTGTASGVSTALKVNVTETAALGQVRLVDLQVGGTSSWTILGTAPIQSAANATWDAFKAAAFTQNFKGNTRINSQISKMAIYAPTLASDTATLTIDKACTFYVDGPPVSGTNVSQTISATAIFGTSASTALAVDYYAAVASPRLRVLGSSSLYIGSQYTVFDGASTNHATLQIQSYQNASVAELRFYNVSGNATTINRITTAASGSGSRNLAILPDGGNVGIGLANTSVGASSRLHVVCTATIASAADAMFRGVYLATETITISGTTNIDTATGLNKFVVEAPTYSNAAITIAKAFTQRIDNAPQVTGGATIAARGALLVSAGSIVCQGAALATNAAEGFLYIPTCAGAPTGTPQTHAGTVPLVYDTTNHKLYLYDGGWRGGTAPGAWT